MAFNEDLMLAELLLFRMILFLDFPFKVLSY
jgi:hypothetical protein